MNRIAILILILIVAALAVLLVHRAQTRRAADFDPAEAQRRPQAALQQAEALIQQARDGAAAAERARETLTTVIENAPQSPTALHARLRLVELERALGNNKAAGDLLLDAVRAHPGSTETPRLLFDLGLLLAGPLDRPDEALEMFKRVASLYPDQDLAPEATLRLARIRMALGTPDQAGQIADLQSLISEQPDHPLAADANLLLNLITAHQEIDHEE